MSTLDATRDKMYQALPLLSGESLGTRLNLVSHMPSAIRHFARITLFIETTPLPLEAHLFASDLTAADKVRYQRVGRLSNVEMAPTRNICNT